MRGRGDKRYAGRVGSGKRVGREAGSGRRVGRNVGQTVTESGSTTGAQGNVLCAGETEKQVKRSPIVGQRPEHRGLMRV